MTYYCIVGLGLSGLSAAKFCEQQGISYGVTDSREHPPCLEKYHQLGLKGDLALSGFSEAMVDRATDIIVSPGVSLKEPVFNSAKKAGKPLIGDIDLFAREAKAPVIAVTGSNGKTTVTNMLGEMINASGRRGLMAGNIGRTVLDVLTEEKRPDVYILELSSFQLERTFELKLKVAVFLNLCEDHMDRYDNLADYAAAKLRIYSNAKLAVYNREDNWTKPNKDQNAVSFGLDEPGVGQFGIMQHKGKVYLAKGDQPLMSVDKLFLEGRHHIQNALAALAAGDALKLDMSVMLEVLRKFRGIPHRCELVRLMQGIAWYNDSKGTNVGATVAALQTMSPKAKGKIILIAGGEGKGADFLPLKPLIKKHVRLLILLGRAAKQLDALMSDVVTVQHVKSMPSAVEAAEMAAVRGDIVLLSPACASTDMFRNFEERGQIFSECVKAL